MLGRDLEIVELCNSGQEGSRYTKELTASPAVRFISDCLSTGITTPDRNTSVCTTANQIACCIKPTAVNSTTFKVKKCSWVVD